MLKRLVRIGLMAVAIAGIGGRNLAASEPMKAIVASYLDIQTQLVSDKTETIASQAHAIGEQAARLTQGGAAVASAAAALEKAGDIKAMRDAFGALSDAVVSAAKADGWTDVSGLKLAYCPMAKRSWLQSGDTIQNPYYGKSMPGCGEFKAMQ